jgi:L-ribulose-5-phosphate 3-epimerase
MNHTSTIDELLAGLNPQQREAATHGQNPLLIVAGAGTGKTATLVHRVAWLIAGGVDPSRILLLTFTRRAAAAMLHRAENLLRRLGHVEKGDCPNFRLSENGTVPFSVPFSAGETGRRITRLRQLLEKCKMRSVIETGARFLLDPHVKHEPTLLSASPRRRIDFYKYAVDCAADLGSDCVSLWSGALCGAGVSPAQVQHSTGVSPALAAETAAPQAMDRLVNGLREVLDYAARQNVLIAFEPEPGMFIDTMPAFEQLLGRIDAPNLRLTLDIGHLQCQGELPIPDVIRRWSSRLVNVHIEDMRRGIHEHLMFGEGEIDFPPVLRTLAEVSYAGGVYVELSRHSHEGPAAARQAFQCMKSLFDRLAKERER